MVILVFDVSRIQVSVETPVRSAVVGKYIIMLLEKTINKITISQYRINVSKSKFSISNNKSILAI